MKYKIRVLPRKKVLYRIIFFLMGICIMSTTSLLSLRTAVYAAQLTRLSNGLQVLVEEDNRFPLVSLRLYVHAGSAYEDPENAGISHLLEHMVFKGTAKRAPGEIARDIENVGGYLNAATGFDHTVYQIDVPDEHWRLGLDVFKDMIFGAAIESSELAREKQVVLSELKRNEDNPNRQLFTTIQPMIWPDSVYERPVIGYEETIKGISRKDIKKYIAGLYQPQSMLLVACGNVKNENIIEEAQKYFGDLENQGIFTPAQPLTFPAQQEEAKIKVRSGPWKKAYQAVAFPVQGFKSEDAPVLEVLAQIMGGDQSSRLYKKYKYDLGLVDDISMSSILLERAGMIYVHAQMDEQNVQELWSHLISDLSQLKAEDITDEELQRAKVNISDSLFQSKETLGGLANKLGFFQFYEHDVREEEQYLFDIQHVTREQIQSVLERYFRSRRVNAVLMVPDESIEEKTLLDTLYAKWPVQEIENEKKLKSEVTPGQVEHISIGKQGTIVLIQDPTLPYTAVSLSWLGGDGLIADNEQGLPELVGRTLIRGTTTKTAHQIQEYLSDRAAQLDVGAGRERFVMNAKFPDIYSEDMYALLLEIVSRPSLTAEEMKKAVADQVADIEHQEDQPLGLIFRNLFPFLFQNHPYSYYHLGQPGVLQTMKRENLIDYWDRQKKEPWVLAVCGRYNREQLMNFAGELPNRFAEKRPQPSQPGWTGKDDLALTLEDRNQAHLLAIFKVPVLDHKDTPALMVLKEALAGQGGRLFRELRDKLGLGYSVTAMLWQTQQAGFMAFYIGTSPETLDESITGFKNIVSELQGKSLSKYELKRAKQLLEGDYYRDHQSLLSRSTEAASLLTRNLDLDFNKRLISKAGKVSGSEVKKVVKRYLDWEEAYIINVTP